MPKTSGDSSQNPYGVKQFRKFMEKYDNLQYNVVKSEGYYIVTVWGKGIHQAQFQEDDLQVIRKDIRSLVVNHNVKVKK